MAMFAVPTECDALWTDKGVDLNGVDEGVAKMWGPAGHNNTRVGAWDGLHFGGFSFKGCRKIPNERIAEFAEVCYQPKVKI